MHRRAVLVWLVLLLGGAAPAAGAPSVKKAIWGPAVQDGVSQFPVYQELGVGILQQTLRWWDVAPTEPADPTDPADPAYRWPAEVDAAVAGARGTGIAVAVAVLGAPPWANGAEDWRTAPRDARRYADFVEAAAKRWPEVRYWLVWIEPTKAQFFQPLAPVGDAPMRTAEEREGMHRYAALVDATYARLRRVQPRAKVVGGNTFTVGAVTPRRWIRALRLRAGRRPRMHLWGHNPFSLRRPVLRQPPNRGGFADFGDLDTLLGWLDRAGHRTPRGRRLKLFLSEYSLPTKPNHEFNFHVTEAVQARWLRDALRESRRTKRIFTFGYLGLFDDPPRPAGDEVLRGLVGLDGRRKPAFDAFRDG